MKMIDILFEGGFNCVLIFTCQRTKDNNVGNEDLSLSQCSKFLSTMCEVQVFRDVNEPMSLCLLRFVYN